MLRSLMKIFLIMFISLTGYVILDSKVITFGFKAANSAAAGEASVIALNDPKQSVEIVEAKKQTALVDVVGLAETGSRDICKPGMNLGRLFVLDELFDDSAMLEPGGTTIKDLIILDRLFFGQCIFQRDNDYSLGDLFALDRLLEEGGSLLDPDKTSLEDLIVLDQLFNN